MGSTFSDRPVRRALAPPPVIKFPAPDSAGTGQKSFLSGSWGEVLSELRIVLQGFGGQVWPKIGRKTEKSEYRVANEPLSCLLGPYWPYEAPIRALLSPYWPL